MKTSELLLVSAPGSNARSRSEALEKSLGVKTHLVSPQQIPMLELRSLYSVIIVDFAPAQGSMCASSTLELCRQIRSRFDNPIVLLLYNASEEQAVSAYATGVDECIVEPIGSNLLAAKVRSWLRWSTAVPSQNGNQKKTR